MAKTTKSSRQIMIILGGIFALVAVVLIALHLSKTPLLVSSEIITVKKSDIKGVLAEDVMLTSVTSADLAFENSGKIKNVFVNVGDQVKKGQILAEEVNSDYAVTLNEEIANQNALEAQVEAAHENVSIQKAKVHALKNASAKKYDVKAQQETVDQAEAQVEAQQSLLNAAQEAVRGANLDLAKTKLLAPADGVITQKSIEVGEVVAQAGPVMQLAEEGNLEADAQISELDLKKITVGNGAEITLSSEAGNSTTLPVRVKTIYPAAAVTNGVSSYKVVFELLGDTTDLKSGLTGTASIQIAKLAGIITIPKSSIFSDSGKKYVMTLASGIPERKEVQTGIYGPNDMVEIIVGLSEGDQIIKF